MQKLFVIGLHFILERVLLLLDEIEVIVNAR